LMLGIYSAISWAIIGRYTVLFVLLFYIMLVYVAVWLRRYMHKLVHE
jgi:hypothetical protein